MMTRLIYLWRSLLYAYSFGVFGTLCLLMFPLCLPLALIPHRWRRHFEGAVRHLCYGGFVFVRWHCRLTGFSTLRIFDSAPKSQGRLLVANHICMFDIVLLFAYMPKIQTLVHSKFVNHPLLWPTIRACGYIPIQPADSAAGAIAFEHIREALAEGQTVVLFPEGTRSLDGVMGPLKNGAFRLAADLKIPMHPIFFTASQPFLNRQAFVPRARGPVILEAHIQAPIDPSIEMDWKVPLLRKKFEECYAEFMRSPLALTANRSLEERK